MVQDVLLFMLFRNIMVPYDGSKYSLRAFKIALDMYGTMIHVTPRQY
jgi:hypothetical protein